MDGSATMAEIGQNFRTPTRILLPKLLKSRNDWKAKSHRRKAELKAAKVNIRDLAASRERWRQRAEQLEEETHQLRERVACAERQLAATQAAWQDAQKK